MPGSDRLEEVEALDTKASPSRKSRAKQSGASEVEVVEAKASPSKRSRPRRPNATVDEPSIENLASSEQQVRRMPRLLEQYRSTVKGMLMEEFRYGNVMQIPQLSKVVLNIGLGETKTNPRAMENATRDLAIISTQKPVITRARRSIAGFKLREGDPIGTAVTLRGNRMYEFMDRLLNAALPRIRDFRGVSRKAFDGHGNYSLGIREQVIFPEIDYGQIDRIRSLQVSIITTASTDLEAMRLLDLLGMPFTRDTVVTPEAINV